MLRNYLYRRKKSIMTEAEIAFFHRLEKVINDKFLIVPQAHLSLIFNHRIEGQTWTHAFSRINGKSVDFLICDKENLKPYFAIELDDRSHELKERKARDYFVNYVFNNAKITLIRFKQGQWKNEEMIKNKIIYELNKSRF